MQKLIQEDLPGFIEEETKARQATIPVEATQRHLVSAYWRFRKYASKCPNNDWDNRRRAWQCSMMLEKHR